LTSLDIQSFPHTSVGFSLLAHQKMADGSVFKCSGCHTKGYIQFDQAICATCHFSLNSKFLTSHLSTFGTGCQACHDGVDSYGHSFNHQNGPFALKGKHASLTCDQCHAGQITLASLKAAPQDCYACHARVDTHQGAFGKDCSQCHTPDSWQSAKVDHSLTAFPLQGKHQAIACSACHLNRVFKGTPTSCYACHAKDDHHNGQFGQDCAACHTADGWLPAAFDHSKSAFPLTGAHLNVNCSKCHLNNVFKGTPTACASCHADPAYHAGLFGKDCAACHTTAAWAPAKFNGPHTFPIGHGGANTCQSCHPASLGVYTCYACHPQDQMAARHQGVSAADLPNCARCHPTGSSGG
jgi:hypothetical protein